MKLYTSIFIIANLLATSNADSAFDQLVDAVLEEIAPKIVLDGYNQINLPDFNYEFSYGLWIVTLYGSVSCEGGKVDSLATMHRIGEAYGDLYNGKFVGSAPVGLYALALRFDKCTVAVKDIFSYSNKVEGTVDKNGLLLNVTVEATETDCIATVDKLQLTQLSGIKITVGSGIFSGLTDQILNSIVSALNGYIIHNVNVALQKYEHTQFHISDLPFVNHFKNLLAQHKRHELLL